MKRLALALIICCAIYGVAFAENVTFNVSCTIPAIPGLNAPPYTEKTNRETLSEPVNELNLTEENAEVETEQIVQEDETALTLYAR
jgi:hypothetical protein